jgi:hypothetical protein
MPDKRTFKIVKIDGKSPSEADSTGRYHGEPLQAARKAFNQHCRKKGIKTCKKKITIKEITKGGDSSEYAYQAERKKLKSPKEVSRGDAVYTVEYETLIKKA